MFRHRVIPGLFVLASVSPAVAADTLQVTSPDPALEQWRWTEFDRSSGLVGGVRNIFEDRDGNIWFATDRGAQRYDGVRWTTYTMEDGLAQNRVSTVIQTRDGAMWFGTRDGGISRFDGETWTTYTTADGLATNSIWWNGLLQARDGTLWAGFWSSFADTSGTQAGISRFDGETWTTVEVPVGPPRPIILDIHQASDGALWFTTTGHGVLRFDLSGWTRYTAEDGLAGNQTRQILESRDGSVWIGFGRGVEGISRFDGRGWRTYMVRDGLPEGINFNILWQTEDGTVWAASGGRGSGGVLCRFDGERWKPYAPEEIPQVRGNVVGVPMRDGAVWIYDHGADKAFRFDYTSTKRMTFTHEEGLFGGYSPPDGSVWFWTRSGAVRYDGKNWLRYTSEDGLLDAPIYGMNQTDDGSLWFFAGEREKFEGVNRYHNGIWRRYTKEEIGLDGTFGNSQSILQTKDGSFWVIGSRKGASAAVRYDGQTWKVYSQEEGLVGRFLSHIYQAENGDLWFGTRPPFTGDSQVGDGLLRFDGEDWTSYTTEDGLAHNRIYGLFQTPDGTIWAGTRIGLSWFDGTSWSSYTYEDGLPAEKPRGFVWHNGDLWFDYGSPGSVGVTRYDGKEWRTYTTLDGVVDNQGRSIYGAIDGTLWFGMAGGVSRFDGTTWTSYTVEDGLPGNDISRIWQSPDGTFWFRAAGGKAGSFTQDNVEPETTIEPALTEISSAGNILLRWSGRDPWDSTPPRDLRYQWRVDGGKWSPWSERADFTLTSLSSGRHSFEVRAVDRDMNVDATPAVHAFVVEAPWWKNPWMIGGTVVLLGLVGVQTGRVVRRDRRLQQTNAALSSANHALFDANQNLTVEAALERVRAKALGMQESKALSNVAVTLFEEFAELGIRIRRPAIFLVDLENDTAEIWTTSVEGQPMEVAHFEARKWREGEGPIPEAFQAFEKGDRSPRQDTFDRDGFEANLKWIRDELGMTFPNYDRDGIPEHTVYHTLYFANGFLLLNTFSEALPDEEVSTVQRFADAFGFAYSRYLELQEKEERNRELEAANKAMSESNKELFQANQALQRDSAVERIRGEVQAMEQASDFERVLSLLSEDLKAVGLSFDTCGIDVLDEPIDEPTMAYFEDHGFQYTDYTIDPDGAVTRESYHIPAPFPPVSRETIERFIAGKPWQGRSEQTAILEVPASNYGRLRITSSDRQDFTEEDIESLQDFASAIALGYARYLDIREIQEQTERKSKFLASMSHELRTPMNAIIGFTRMVLRREKNISERNRDNLEKVRVSADHLLNLINGILDLSKIEAGQTDVNVERFDVKGLVASCCAEVEPLVEARPGLKLEYSVSVGEANTDPGRLRQIVINLLSNAIKFTDQGEVAVRVSQEGQADGEKSLVIAVSDTGSGIPADALESIFEEFQQVKGSDPQHKGTGLGLPITKGFTELLGGTIGVQSEVGKGSTFTVRMPVVYSLAGTG